MSTITLPEGYQYVAASLLSTVFVLAGQTMVVSRHRKAAGIAYPQLYAEKAEMEKSPAAFKFNCAQRAHQNTLEYMPAIILTTLITSINFPVYAASACGAWSLGRVLYTRGYVTGDPKKRNSSGGFLSSLALLTLVGSSTWSVAKLFL